MWCVFVFAGRGVPQHVCVTTCVCMTTCVCACVRSRWVQVLAPQHHPAGRFVLVADMSNIKLGQAMGEGQVTAAGIKTLAARQPGSQDPS